MTRKPVQGDSPREPQPVRVAIAACLAMLLCAGGPLALAAAFDPVQFDAPELETRYRHLIAELRCLVCQNQNIADSDAELAGDLRRQVHEMLQRGETDAAIIDYMVQRYGDFVLYKPPLRPATALLWGAPVLLGAGGLLLLVRLVRRRASSAALPVSLSERERERLNTLLKPADTRNDHDGSAPSEQNGTPEN